MAGRSEIGGYFEKAKTVLKAIASANPEKKDSEILRCLKQLSSQNVQCRDDTNDLRRKLKLKIPKMRYDELVDRIYIGMDFCVKIREASTKDEETKYQEKLKGVCAHENLPNVLSDILDEVTGRKHRGSILDELYNDAKGDRQEISDLAMRLLELVCVGMIALTTYEKLMRGEEVAKKMSEKYESRLNEVYAKIQSVLGRCVESVKADVARGADSARPVSAQHHKKSAARGQHSYGHQKK